MNVFSELLSQREQVAVDRQSQHILCLDVVFAHSVLILFHATLWSLASVAHRRMFMWCLLQAQLIAQSIGQAFSVAYQEFLRANGINPEDLSQKEYSDIINTQEMYNDDLIHFSNSENCKEVGPY